MQSARINRRFHFVQYPIFKIVLFVGIGIFIGDLFYGWSGLKVLICALTLVSVSASFLTFTHKSYGSRWVFGLPASTAFVCLGALLLVIERNKTEFEWNEDSLYYKGIVLDIPQHGAKTWHSRVRVEAGKEDGSWREIDKTIILYWMPDSMQADVNCGDHLCFSTKVKASADQDTLGTFDYGKYLTRRNISGTAIAYSGDWRKLDNKPELTLRQKSLLFREKLVANYREWGLQGDELAIVMALTVGDKDELDEELKSAYNAAGASHVLALSGLHVGIIAAFIMMLLYPLRRRRLGKFMAEAITMCLLWAFAFVTGLSPSVLRAVTLISLYFLASWINGTAFNGISSLSLGALIMLLAHPQYMFEVGFQMSFASVFFILFSSIFYRDLLDYNNFFSRKLLGAILMTCAAQLGVMPLTLYYFGTFPTYFLLSSLVVIPLATCLLWTSMAAFVLHSVPFLGDLLKNVLSFLSSVMNASVETVQSLPGSQIHLRINAWQIFLIYVFLIFFINMLIERTFIRTLTVIFLACIILVLPILQKEGIIFLPN